MNDNSYEAYKKSLSRSRKQSKALHDGKIQLVLGICFFLYLLWILPFRTGDVSRIRGDEVKAGNPYGHIQVYYIDRLHILRARTDTNSGQIYCIAKFADCDQNEWVLSFSPGRNEQLAERIRLSSSLESELDLTVYGYFQLEALEDLPFEADSFFSVYADKYANAEGSNLLSLNADYLCERSDNPVSKLLSRPGIPLVSLVVGLIGILWGGFLLIKYQKRETN